MVGTTPARAISARGPAPLVVARAGREAAMLPRRAALPAHRRARADRRPAHGRAGGHRRHDRLVLLPALRLAERLRLDPRRRPRRLLPHRARTARAGRSKQLYLPDTNVLITRFLMPDGVGEVQDFMPVAAHRRGGAPPPHRAPRARGARADDLRGRASRPASTTGAPRHEVGAHRRTARSSARRTLTLALSTRSPARDPRRHRRVRAHLTLEAGRGGHLLPRPRRWTASRRRPLRRGRLAPVRRHRRASGGAGWAARATAGAGARWSIAPR